MYILVLFQSLYVCPLFSSVVAKAVNIHKKKYRVGFMKSLFFFSLVFFFFFFLSSDLQSFHYFLPPSNHLCNVYVFSILLYVKRKNKSGWNTVHLINWSWTKAVSSGNKTSYPEKRLPPPHTPIFQATKCWTCGGLSIDYMLLSPFFPVVTWSSRNFVLWENEQHCSLLASLPLSGKN